MKSVDFCGCCRLYSGGGRDSEKASKEQRIVDECGWALSCLVVNELSTCFVFFGSTVC